MFTTELRRNIMGGTNVLITLDGRRYSVLSYATRSNALRAVRSGAAVRVAVRIESR